MKNKYHMERLELIEFHIVEHCNLNCKSCIHFSPLAEKSCIKLTDFKKDVKSMSKITRGNVNTINILGGEPLLHPDLLKILKITRQYFQDSEIRMVSNGLLILSQKEEFWKILQKYNIHLSLTEYPLNINYQKIQQLTQQYKIKYTFYASNKENAQWHFPIDVKGEQSPIHSFMNCKKGNNCTNINIRKGKLYICPIAGNLMHFNKYFKLNLALETSDYLCLNQISNIKQIQEFISKPSPACRFCNIQGRTFENSWEVSQKNIKEWI